MPVKSQIGVVSRAMNKENPHFEKFYEFRN